MKARHISEALTPAEFLEFLQQMCIEATALGETWGAIEMGIILATAAAMLGNLTDVRHQIAKWKEAYPDGKW